MKNNILRESGFGTLPSILSTVEDKQKLVNFFMPLRN